VGILLRTYAAYIVGNAGGLVGAAPRADAAKRTAQVAAGA